MREEEEVQVNVNWKEPSVFDNPGHVHHASTGKMVDYLQFQVSMRLCIPHGTRQVTGTVTVHLR